MVITVFILIALAFAAGFFAGVINANSSKVAKAKAIAEELRK